MSNASDLFEALDKMNPDASVLSENPLSLVKEWIDTGNYAFNAILSGSCYGGVPKGRIVGFSGPSGCGKTLLINKIIGNFQRKDPEAWGVVFDSEIAVDAATAAAVGADPKRIKHVPVNTVEDVRNQVLALLDRIIEQKMQGKIIIGIDSLGNLAGSKEVGDAEEGKSASDMGTRAKSIKSMLRVLTYRAARANTTIIFSNHEYSNPASMYPSIVHNQSGGEGPIYLASLLVQLGFRREKNEDDYEKEEILGQAKKVGGITITALSVKNRFIPQMLFTELYLNFKTGLDRYSGLFEMAKNLNLITGSKTWECEGQKLGYRKDFERDPKVWEEIILPKLEALITKEFRYSSAVEDLKKEVAQIK